MTEHHFSSQPSHYAYTKGCRCDDCRKIYSDYTRNYRLKNPDRVRGYEKRKTVTPEQTSKYNLTYRQSHPATMKESRRKWSQLNKPYLREKSRQWRADHPNYNARYKDRQPLSALKYRTSEKGRLAVNFRRSQYVRRHLNAAGNATPTQLKARWDFYGGLCYLCGLIATAMDHVIPLNKGGSNWPANLRPACKKCNSQKSDISLAAFLARRANQ
jgi:5-methylcytosine-specific restriction endonuclease McrA